jgi:hypothetical protein
LVDRASSIGHLVLGHPLEGGKVVSTVTSVHVSLARDQVLGRDVDIGPHGLTGDLHAVGEDGSSSVSPARSTVLRDVLVEDVSEEVSGVSSRLSHIVPKDFFREILNVSERLSDVLENRRLRFDEVGVFTVNVNTGVNHSAEQGNNCERFHMYY